MEPIENKGLERAVDQVRRAHGSEPIRGLQDVARSTLYEGRFGRMFRNLPPFLPPDQDLIALAGRMFEPAGAEEDEGLDTGIPAGFTYFGQFVDHDITFDPNSKQAKPPWRHQREAGSSIRLAPIPYPRISPKSRACPLCLWSPLRSPTGAHV